MEHKQQQVRFDNTELPDIIELKNICQTYDGGSTFVIDGLNILIEAKPNQGQFVVVLGGSGCGKSTVLRYICGLQKPTSGEVLIYGKPRSEADQIAMVFQQYSSFPWYTVLQNVMIPLRIKGMAQKEAKAKAKEMIAKVGLSGHENKYAQYPILSGGQLQRVAIARSLISNPKILLMDEPFGALDIHTRHEMQILLAQIWEELNSTIVFVTHDIREAVFLGDDIWVMDSNPGQIEGTFHVNLPFHRDRATTKTAEFIGLAQQIEDHMFELKNKK